MYMISTRNVCVSFNQFNVTVKVVKRVSSDTLSITKRGSVNKCPAKLYR
jgi:hypothetical protein